MMKKNDNMLGRPLFIAVAITHCCCCCHSTIIHCYPTIVVVTYRSRRPLILDTEFPPPWPLPLPRPLMPLVVRQQTELLLQLKLLEASATTTGMLLLRVVAVAIIAVAADIRHDKVASCVMHGCVYAIQKENCRRIRSIRLFEPCVHVAWLSQPA